MASACISSSAVRDLTHKFLSDTGAYGVCVHALVVLHLKDVDLKKRRKRRRRYAALKILDVFEREILSKISAVSRGSAHPGRGRTPRLLESTSSPHAGPNGDHVWPRV
ncbi:hypothetical protein ISF_08447 [Cordyceps fumosorosea ARSEF 2679]|uniref:Uncharacterized protein n=1 Tax=Cordyceps fumosorosea (strain ARSEF 2679) TaxID=1081104 RepID=A0A162MCI7_CORFA|nr:hypothetical protein ISF_08447 [Cordyceps fumosorosea ARSEF 2679]OAA54220.1 hypothetical protein ISF_08447 [Cordyceps fumosorosea ARSEF 2679]